MEDGGRPGERVLPKTTPTRTPAGPPAPRGSGVVGLLEAELLDLAGDGVAANAQALRGVSVRPRAALQHWRDGQDRGSLSYTGGVLPPTSVAGGGFNNEITVNQPEMFHVGLQRCQP